MEAITYDARNKKLDLIKTNIPDVKDPNDVLIKVAFAGICGTDLHIIQVFLLFLFFYLQIFFAAYVVYENTLFYCVKISNNVLHHFSFKFC